MRRPNKMVIYQTPEGQVRKLEISGGDSNKTIRRIFYPNKVLKVKTLRPLESMGSQKMERMK